MNDQELALAFELHRSRMQAIAYRLLGSFGEAEDAVQELWFRLSRSDASAINNLGGWMTTAVSRICLDMLRRRQSRREQLLDGHSFETLVDIGKQYGPEQETLLADSIGIAMKVVLDRLNPAERIAFILHDVFRQPFSEIAPILNKSEAAVRKLASRARRKVQEYHGDMNIVLAHQLDIVDAFLHAAQTGDFDGLIAALDPEVCLVDDRQVGSPAVTHGAVALAKQVAGRANTARPALVNGSMGAAVTLQARLLYVLVFTVRDEKIKKIELISDPDRLSRLDLKLL